MLSAIRSPLPTSMTLHWVRMRLFYCSSTVIVVIMAAAFVSARFSCCNLMLFPLQQIKNLVSSSLQFAAYSHQLLLWFRWQRWSLYEDHFLNLCAQYSSTTHTYIFSINSSSQRLPMLLFPNHKGYNGGRVLQKGLKFISSFAYFTKYAIKFIHLVQYSLLTIVQSFGGPYWPCSFLFIPLLSDETLWSFVAVARKRLL